MAKFVPAEGANVNCFPLDNTEFTAAEVGAYTCTNTRGVFSDEDCFQCTASGGRSITISPGVAWLKRNRFWGVEFNLKEPVTVTLDVASGTLSRYVSVVVQLDFAANKPVLGLRYGDLSTTPKKDLPVRNEYYDELVLHTVFQKAGSVEVTAADIEDLRPNEGYCGVVRDGVNGIPTQQLSAQAETIIAQLRAARDTAESGAAPNGFYLYTHSYNPAAKVHNLVPTDDGTGATGPGTNGKMLVTAAVSAGDTFAVNGVAVPAYMGAEGVDELPVGRWVTFVFDGTQVVFGGGGGGFKMDLLWKNANPSAAFPPQDVNIAWENYEYIYIMGRAANYSTQTASLGVGEARAGSAIAIYYPTFGGYSGIRNATITTGKAQFAAGYYGIGAAANNDYCIPTHIFGVKWG